MWLHTGLRASSPNKLGLLFLIIQKSSMSILSVSSTSMVLGHCYECLSVNHLLPCFYCMKNDHCVTCGMKCTECGGDFCNDCILVFNGYSRITRCEQHKGSSIHSAPPPSSPPPSLPSAPVHRRALSLNSYQPLCVKRIDCNYKKCFNVECLRLCQCRCGL